MLKPKQKLTGWLTSATSSVLTWLLQPKTVRLIALLLTVLLLTPLVLSLTACVHQPTQPSQPPEYPRKPALTEPLPSTTYSKAVQQKSADWQKRLTGTSATSAP